VVVRIAPQGALDTSRAATLKISLPFKKRKGVQGEAAKKLKGNFWVLRVNGTQG
jgi:hypothetical protein